MSIEIQNPIPAAARGVIYVLSLTVAAFTTTIVSVLDNLGYSSWDPTVIAAAGGLAALASSLAVANLTVSNTPTDSYAVYETTTTEGTDGVSDEENDELEDSIDLEISDEQS